MLNSGCIALASDKKAVWGWEMYDWPIQPLPLSGQLLKKGEKV